MIIDAHTHMPSFNWIKRKPYYESIEQPIEYMRSLGIERAIFNTWQGVLSETADDINRGNSEAFELAELSGGFLYPGIAMNPMFPETSLRWLKEFHQRGYRWAGELLTYSNEPKFKYTSPEFVVLVKHCETLGFLVQLHCQPEIVDLAKIFPSLPIVCSHISDDDEVLRRLADCENVWLDISGMAGGLVIGRLEKACEIFTARRLIFGSDYTGYDPQCFIARVKSVIPADMQNDVFYCNVVSLLEKIGSNPIV